MDDDEAALVAAIRADPGADAPRLAYAAWLEARDDLRGELMRVQWELAHLPLDGRSGRRRHETLRAREDQLLPKILFPSYRRGRDGWWLAPRDAELATRTDDLYRVFARDLLIDGPLDAPRFAALLQLLPLARLRTFGWTRTLAPSQLAELAGSGAWDALTTLDLPRAQLGDDGAAALASAKGLSRLETLGLSGNGIGAGARALAAADTLASVRALDLSSNVLTGADACALVASPALVELDLSRNDLGAAGVAALCDTAGLERLRGLGLAGCGLGPAAVRALADCPRLAGLARLRLSANALEASAVRALLESPHLPNTLTLELDPHQLGLHREVSYDGPIAVAEWWDGPPRTELKSRYRLACVFDPSLGVHVTRADERFLGGVLPPWY